MTILFEKGLKSEADFFKKVIRKIFVISAGSIVSETKTYFKYNRTVKGYEPERVKSKIKHVILTKKDLFIPNAKSKEDDYIYGYSTGKGLFFISGVRLKGKSDNPTTHLSIPRTQYYKRLKNILLHELGHELIKNQKHYKNYVIINPKTGYRTPTGKHCPNEQCIMSQVEDLEMLDAHIRKSYKDYFCRKCKPLVSK